MNCIYNGVTIADGETTARLMYQTSSVAYSMGCELETQTAKCVNGELSWTGSFEYPACSVDLPSSCEWLGEALEHGASATRVMYQVCADVACAGLHGAGCRSPIW